MSTIMTEHDQQHVSTLTQKIQARALDITTDEITVAWESSTDIGMALRWAGMAKGVSLPHSAEGGLVIVGLEIDNDEDLHAVSTEGTSTRDDVEVIDRAIVVLQHVRDGLVAAQGGAR